MKKLNKKSYKKPQELFINVSEYDAPEPFEKVLQLVSEMKDGEYIRVLHRKKPLPLVQMLQENGFDYCILPGQQTQWEIIIWNIKDSSTADYCSQQLQSTSKPGINPA